MRILITGVEGYIGKSLHKALRDKHFVTAIARKEVDLEDPIFVKAFFDRSVFFDIVIHCAVAGGSRLEKDSWNVMDKNLIMYYNLLANRSRFSRLIHFGSGAETYMPKEPYGYSKKVIAKSILNQDNFYNLKIFAVFDENELETRFIKSSILKYLNNQPIEIHQDKLMDFFYMKDLITLMEYCISADDLPKEINCSYKSIYHLKDIANIINRMDDHNVPIRVVNKKIGTNYTGNFTNLGIDYIGIEEGIENVFNELKERNDKAN